MNSTTRAALGMPLLGAALVAAGLASCVAQEQYDDAQISAKHYQKKSIDLEGRLSQLEEENRVLKAQLEAGNVAIEDAAFTQGIDERLKHLQSILAELGGQPGDVTKFQVDGGYVYRIKDPILFALGSSEVSEAGQKVLAEIASDINSRPHDKVYVRGHTDNLPVSRPETRQRFPHGNLQLSAARAVEVGAYLATRGKVPDDSLVVMGFGPSEPVARNDSDANRALNRRVEIFVSDPSSAKAKGS